jgi:hypothetical protein
MANRTNILITILVLVVVILAGVVIFTFLIRPSFNGYIIDKQIEAQNVLLANIVLQVQQTGFVQIPVGNQSLFLAPFNPQQTQPRQ